MKDWTLVKTFSSYGECRGFVLNAGIDSVSPYKLYKLIKHSKSGCVTFRCLQHAPFCSHQYKISQYDFRWSIQESGQHLTELLDLRSAMPSVSFQHKVHSAKIEQCLQDGVVTAKKIVSRLAVLNSGGLTKRQIKNCKFRLTGTDISQHINSTGAYSSNSVIICLCIHCCIYVHIYIVYYMFIYNFKLYVHI